MDISQVRNPYNYRHPVRDAATFAGRSEEAAAIEEELSQAQVGMPSICVVLHGRRAAGKTSLLYAAERMATTRGLTTARVELIEGDGEPIAFFRKIYEELVLAVLAEADRAGNPVDFDVAAVRRVMAGVADASTVPPLQFPEAIALAGAEGRVPDTALRDDLSFFIDLLGHPIALLVDEAQLIADDSRSLSVLRFLTTRVDGLVLVLAGTSGLIERIKEVHSQILRQFREIEVKGFVEETDVEECVARPLRNAGLYGGLLSANLVSSLRRLTDGNPYAIQLYCHEMFARMQRGLTQYMELSPEVLAGIKFRMERGDRDVLDRPLIRAVRAMSRNELIAFNVLTSALGHATPDEAWFAYGMVGRPEITYEEFTQCRQSLVDQGILKDEDTVTLADDSELFDEVYCRLWSAETLGTPRHSQAISQASVRAMLLNRLLGLLHDIVDIHPARIFPTCCYQFSAKHLEASLNALEKLPDAGPDSIPEIDFLHYSILNAGEPQALDITTVTCTYQNHTVERWLCTPDTDGFSLSETDFFRAAVDQVAALGGTLTAEPVRVPLRTWPAENWFLKATGRLRSELAINHRTAAMNAYRAGDVARARARFQSSFDLEPDWDAANCLMYLSVATGHEDALAWSRRALSLADDAYARALCHYNAAMAHLTGGDRDEAAAELSRAAAELAPISLRNHLLGFLLLPSADGGTTLHEETDVDLVEAVQRASAIIGVTSTPSPDPDHSQNSEHGSRMPPAEAPAQRSAEEERATTTRPGQGPVVLSVATEWASANGGLSTFNRDLCRALSAAGARVFCVVLHATAAEHDAAEEANVTLLPRPVRPGESEDVRLSSRPNLPDGVSPDLILGHGRITGPAAQKLAEDFYPTARRLHFLHMAPDTIEWYKPDRTNDAALRAEDRTRIERRLGRSAHRVFAVGPRLHQEFLAEFRTSVGKPPQRIDPGFDSPEPDVDRAPPPGSPSRVLLLGRVDDAQLKGLDLAAAACAQADDWLRAEGVRRGIRLLVRGAPVTDADRARTQMRRVHPQLDTVIRVYTAEQDRIDDDLDSASLVLMPSRQEGFGLVGLEAITRGIPVLVSSESGLADLLHETLGPEHAGQFVVEVSGDEAKDTQAWARAVWRSLTNRAAAFDQAAHLRTLLAERIRWAQAAEVVLMEAPLSRTELSSQP
ncbi:glycosyltransferase [Streptomyces sp. YJ-C3]